MLPSFTSSRVNLQEKFSSIRAAIGIIALSSI